jgi:hypothetical protein
MFFEGLCPSDSPQRGWRATPFASPRRDVRRTGQPDPQDGYLQGESGEVIWGGQLRGLEMVWTEKIKVRNKEKRKSGETKLWRVKNNADTSMKRNMEKNKRRSCFIIIIDMQADGGLLFGFCFHYTWV